MLNTIEDLQISQAAQLITDSQRSFAFTGAGISTESGIPDFRSEDSGLWENVDPLTVASIYGFRRNPQAFYDWVYDLAHTTFDAQPNAAHLALADLERRGRLKGIITQNIDGLHTRAGSHVVHELHGHMRSATCISCFTRTDGQHVMDQFLADRHLPTCEHCGGVLKPDVILFGEQLPIRPLQAAQEAARRAQVMIVIGSSLEVAPASELPTLAKRSGAKLIIINLASTHMDAAADIVIRGRAAKILPQIVQRMEVSK